MVLAPAPTRKGQVAAGFAQEDMAAGMASAPPEAALGFQSSEARLSQARPSLDESRSAANTSPISPLDFSPAKR